MKNTDKGLKVRRMRLSDRDKMVQIVKGIWDGHDYLPLVFDSWVNDKKGMFIAAVNENDELVGFEKLTMLSESDAWIEGLRKDMASGVKGVGRFLTQYILSELAKDNKIKTIRFATYFQNQESIGLFSKLGFRVLERSDHKSYRLPKIGFIPEYKGNRAEVCYDQKAVFRYIERSDWKKKNRYGLCHSWVMKPYSEDVIYNDYVSKGQCLAVKEKEKIMGLCIYSIREKEDFFISMIEAESPSVFRELIQKAKQLSYKEGRESLCVVVNQKDKISKELFGALKFKSWESEGDFLLFDLPLEMLKDNR
ncbi:MAG: GNAT family N-acetyltransferase [Candidatus Delongbacteria bacterium]|nr:GNAT family N-acetyltransferase [Candidatus Delongbacteria bacterium]